MLHRACTFAPRTTDAVQHLMKFLQKWVLTSVSPLLLSWLMCLLFAVAEISLLMLFLMMCSSFVSVCGQQGYWWTWAQAAMAGALAAVLTV